MVKIQELASYKSYERVLSLSPLCDAIPDGMPELTEVWSPTKVSAADTTTEEGIKKLLNI